MKTLSYAVFRHPYAREFEWRAYVRGMYFNLRMNKLLYPSWSTSVCLDEEAADGYRDLYSALGAVVRVQPGRPSLCEAMLWRMMPVFAPDNAYTHVLCRDADALTTYREACAVTAWLASGRTAHSLLDHPCHTVPLTGGMIGFVSGKLKAATGLTSWEQMIATFGDLSVHGSDQTALARHVYPKIEGDTLVHDLTGGKTVDVAAEGVDPRLWESNSTCRHIGSAGVVELETIRFFKRFDPDNYDELEKQYPRIFYWHA